MPLELVRRPEVIAFENGDNRPARHAERLVVGVRQTRDPPMGSSDEADSWIRELLDDLGRSIRRAVVNDDLFPARLGREDAPETSTEIEAWLYVGVMMLTRGAGDVAVNDV